MQTLIEESPLVMIALPAIVVWVLLVVDVLSRSELRRGQQAAWVAGITLFFPFGLLWLLIRPGGAPHARHVARPDSDDLRARLVDLVIAHDRGDIDDEAFAAERDRIVGGPAS